MLLGILGEIRSEYKSVFQELLNHINNITKGNIKPYQASFGVLSQNQTSNWQ